MPEPPPPSQTSGSTATIVLTVCAMLGTLMQALDSTIANVALPYMQGFLAARFGRSRLFVTSIIGFTLTSILCGLAQSLDQLVIFRVLQGLFGGSLVPLSQSVLFDLYPGERRGPAMALWGIGVQVGPILGPILGGWLTEHYSWRWVFYINVPFGVLASAGLIIFLKDELNSAKPKLDWLGFATLSIAIGAFQIMLDRGEQMDWFTSREIIVEAVVAGFAFYLFLTQSLLAPRPFLSPKMFKDLNFVVGLIFIFLIGLVLFATLALLSPFLQILLNYPVVTAGLVLAPRGIGTMLSMVVAGRLVGRLGARPLVFIGLLLSAFSLYQMTQWNTDISQRDVIVTGLFQGFGLGLVFLPISTVIFTTLPPGLRTEAAGVFSLVRNLGSAIGISVTSALLETDTQVNHAEIAASVTPFNRALQTGAASAFWNPHFAAGASVLNAEVTRQSNLIAYLDNFKLMLVLSLATLPLVLLLRSARSKPAAVPK
jgi:DHA2 family multidrug resistance protein